ncbi:cytochrome P450 3A29-like isoform X2 [Actinia tenebrosa]|nr:cytochrome P450 3A29-like isoform X2 [Actinia tenebrosa]
MVVVADPELVKLITVKDFDKFRNRHISIKLPPPNNSGIGAAVDDQWKRIRSTLTPTFSASKMKQMVSLIDESCQVLIGKFREAADTGRTIKASSCYQQYILEVLLKTAFGMEVDFQNNPNEKIVTTVRSSFESRQYLDMFFKSLPFSSLAMKLFSQVLVKKFFSFFNGIAMQIIQQRKEKGVDAGRKDLMYLMMNTVDNEGERKLTDDEISAQSVTFLTAGLHTTSTFLSIASYWLAHYPEIQDKLIEEIDAAFAANPEKPIYDLIHELEYLDCFFNETLRFSMAAELQISRHCSQTCTINGVHFPRGTVVVLCYFLLHNDPDAWEEPFKFDPERHRGPVKEKRHPYQFHPFGVGPRSCIGMRLAQLEGKLTLVRLLREFRFALAPETKHPDGSIPKVVEIRVENRH